MPEDKPEDHSDIPPIEIPAEGFKTEIPSYILPDITPKERYLYDKIGKIEHYIQWSAPILTDSNKQIRKINGNLKRAKEDIVVLKEQMGSWLKVKRFTIRVVSSKTFIVCSILVLSILLSPVYAFIVAKGGLINAITTLFTG